MNDQMMAREVMEVSRDLAALDADPWISADQVELVCAACAASMRSKGIKAVRASVLRKSKMTWQQCIDKAKKNPDVKDPEKLCGWLKNYGPNASTASEMDAAAAGVVASVMEMISKYPDSAPTEKERKLWREQGEKRRRHEGVRPRKSAVEIGRVMAELQKAAKTVSFCRFGLLTSLFGPDDVEAVMEQAKAVIEEAKKVIGVCQKELSMPVTGSTKEKSA